MITSVCLKPCIDRTMTVNGLKTGQLNRVVGSRTDPAGKGYNVAMVLNRLGVASRLIGINGTENGDIFTAALKAEGVPDEFAWQKGEVRTNIKLIDISDGTMTEINENGEKLDRATMDEFMRLFDKYRRDSDWMCFSGSIPVGCDNNIYQRLMSAFGGRSVLDASGESFAAGIEAKPFLVKPNDFELSCYLGRTVKTVPECLDGALELIKRGVTVACVSMGENGALITDGNDAFYAPRVPVKVLSTVGAGDSLVAGLLKGFVDAEGLEQTFCMGVASATACVITPGTELLRPEDYTLMLKQVKIEKIKL